MKATLKKILIRLKTLPIVGKVVRFAIAFYRIPRTRAQMIGVLEMLPRLESAQRQHHDKVNQEVNEQKTEVANLRASTEYILGRLEFVRRELMFEMRYGGKDIKPSDRGAEPKIISAEKVKAARSGKLKLNLGCGHVPLEGYLNVDRRELPGVDVVAEVANLPFEAGEVDEVFSAHVLEHFPQEQLRRELLPYWKSLIKPLGTFRAIVPDGEAMIREFSAGRYPYDELREVLYGAQDYDGDFHHNIFTPAHLSALLREAGFSEIKLVETGRRNGLCYEFEITAKHPA